MRRCLVLLIALCVLPAALRAQAPGNFETDVPEHHAADGKAAVVTARNLMASERFWPYQVALARPWQPAGRAEPIPPGIAGVLIRVEDPNTARIDFGRDGVYEVPVGDTDLLERANRIRSGELEKMAPNFVLDIGPRLMDATSDPLRFFGLRATAERSLFLCVFADPGAPGFAELAGALAPLKDRAGLLTILFAQGSHPDERLRDQLRALGWPTPFVLDHLAETYTPSLLGDATLPALLLVSREGRVLFRGPWRPESMSELRAALDQARTDERRIQAQR